ncbi:MAG: 4Fe-4S dicluster domain-containing protein [Clostridiaceae bacterium]
MGCGICIRVCSPAAIEKTVEKTEEGQKVTMKFNMGSCTFCQFCADFCPKKAITLSTEYSMVTTDKNSLIFEGSFIKKLPPKPPAKKIEQKETKND